MSLKNANNKNLLTVTFKQSQIDTRSHLIKNI